MFDILGSFFFSFILLLHYSAATGIGGKSAISDLKVHEGRVRPYKCWKKNLQVRVNSTHGFFCWIPQSLVPHGASIESVHKKFNVVVTPCNGSLLTLEIAGVHAIDAHSSKDEIWVSDTIFGYISDAYHQSLRVKWHFAAVDSMQLPGVRQFNDHGFYKKVEKYTISFTPVSAQGQVADDKLEKLRQNFKTLRLSEGACLGGIYLIGPKYANDGNKPHGACNGHALHKRDASSSDVSLSDKKHPKVPSTGKFKKAAGEVAKGTTASKAFADGAKKKKPKSKDSLTEKSSKSESDDKDDDDDDDDDDKKKSNNKGLLGKMAKNISAAKILGNSGKRKKELEAQKKKNP